MVHKRQMLDGLWFSLLGGVLIGAVSLAVGGAPLAFALLREQRLVREDLRRAIEGIESRQAGLDEAIAATDDRITVEVKKRASQAGLAARQAGGALDAELVEAVARRQRVPAGPRLLGRGTVPRADLVVGGNSGAPA